jgi:aminoglycoside 6'-N-acetyltransferase
MLSRDEPHCSCADEIQFVPVDEEHLPLLAGWLAEPHVRQWWGDPAVEIELIREGRASGEADGYVGFVDGRPVGYVQSWEPLHFIGAEPWLADLPPGTIGVDIFVGPRELVGRGIGARLIAAFVARLCVGGHQSIVIDPDLTNIRAIRAYEKAGFVRDRIVAGPNGNGETLLMFYRPPVEFDT